MSLTALQAYDIEKALIAGRTIDAVKLYREATGCSLLDAKNIIDEMKMSLTAAKPRHFKEQGTENSAAAAIRPVSRSRALIVFLLVNSLIFASVLYYFFLRDRGDRASLASTPAAVISPQRSGRPKTFSLPAKVSIDSYYSKLADDESFAALYQQKITMVSGYLLQRMFRKKPALAATTNCGSISTPGWWPTWSTSASILAAARASPVSVRPASAGRVRSPKTTTNAGKTTPSMIGGSTVMPLQFQ